MTTKGQRAVLESLQGESAFLAAQDIHARLRAEGSPVGLTSVYRAAQAWWLDVLLIYLAGVGVLSAFILPSFLIAADGSAT